MPTVTHLDYPGAKLSIEADNPVEQTYRARACAKEPWTPAFIESVPAGAYFWDVGANVGPYSLIAVHRGLAAIAVEPGFNNYAALCRNLAMNSQLDRCLTLCLALGERTTFDWFHYGDTRAGAASHVLGGQRKTTFHKQLVQVWRWDDLAARLPLNPATAHYAKIDVDGGELGVLRGAPEFLARVRGILVEMHASQEADITKLLTEAGLKLTARYDERDGKQISNLAYGKFERG